MCLQCIAYECVLLFKNTADGVLFIDDDRASTYTAFVLGVVVNLIADTLA